MAVDGSIRIKVEDKPAEVCLWQVTNSKARDFRLEAIGPAYKKSRLEPGEGESKSSGCPSPTRGRLRSSSRQVFDVGRAAHQVHDPGENRARLVAPQDRGGLEAE